MSLFQNIKISSLFLWQICSLMRGGIAERGGIRVGHRIIEINGQSVVATSHDKIIHILTSAVGEVGMEALLDFLLLQMQWNIIRTYSHFFLSLGWQIHLKTMPASTYRLLTGQEQPVFLWTLHQGQKQGGVPNMNCCQIQKTLCNWSYSSYIGWHELLSKDSLHSFVNHMTV